MSWKNVQVGDIVRGYQKGIHKVTAITDGCGAGKCFHLQRILNSNYTLGKGKSMCDATYIVPVDKAKLEQELLDYTKEALDNVRKYL